MFDRITEKWNKAMDEMEMRMDAFLQLHYPMLWVKDYARLFKEIVSVVVPASAMFFVLQVMTFLTESIYFAVPFGITMLIILFGGVVWLYELIVKNEIGLGRIKKLGSEALGAYSIREDKIASKVILGVWLLVIIYPLYLVGTTIIIADIKVVDTDKKREQTYIISRYKNPTIDSALVGLICYEFNQNRVVKKQDIESSSAMVFDSLKLNLDTVYIKGLERKEVDSILANYYWKDSTRFFHLYYTFFHVKIPKTKDSRGIPVGYLDHVSYSEANQRLLDYESPNDSNSLFWFLMALVFVITCFGLQFWYFRDINKLDIPVEDSAIRRLIPRALLFFILLFLTIFIVFPFYINEDFKYIHSPQRLLKAMDPIFGGRFLDLFSGFFLLILLPVFTYAYFFVFPKIKYQSIKQFFLPQTGKKDLSKPKLLSIQYFNTLITPDWVRTKLELLEKKVCIRNPEIWKRNYIIFTYQSIASALIFFLLSIVCIILLVTSYNLRLLNWQWVYASTGVINRLFLFLPPLFVVLFYISYLMSQSNRRKSFERTGDYFFNLKNERHLFLWLFGILLFLIGIRKFFLLSSFLIVSSFSDNSINFNTFTKRVFVPVNLNLESFNTRLLHQGEYYFLTSEDKKDSIEAVNLIYDSISHHLDPYFYRNISKSDIFTNIQKIQLSDSVNIINRYGHCLGYFEMDSTEKLKTTLLNLRKDKKNIVSAFQNHQLTEESSNQSLENGAFFIYLCSLFYFLIYIYFDDLVFYEVNLNIRQYIFKNRLIAIPLGIFIVISTLALTLILLDSTIYKNDLSTDPVINAAMKLTQLPGKGFLYGMFWLYKLIYPVIIPVFFLIGFFILPKIKYRIYARFFRPE